MQQFQAIPSDVFLSLVLSSLLHSKQFKFMTALNVSQNLRHFVPEMKGKFCRISISFSYDGITAETLAFAALRATLPLCLHVYLNINKNRDREACGVCLKRFECFTNEALVRLYLNFPTGSVHNLSRGGCVQLG